MSIRNLKPAPSKALLEQLILQGSPRTYRKGNTVVRQGDCAGSIFVVLHGVVTISVKSGGATFIAGYRLPGDLIGAEDFLLADQTPSQVSVTCKTPCTLAEINHETIRKTATAETYQLLGHFAAAAARNLTLHASGLALTHIKERLHQALMTMAELPSAMSHPKGMKLKHTQKEMADAINTSRETVGRLLRSMEDEGLISTEHRKVIIHTEKPLYRRA